MLSVSPNCVIRSSLEDMLLALQRRDENDWPLDVPPALPRRVVSRSRPPLAKRRLPVCSEADATGMSLAFCVGKGGFREQNKIGTPKPKGFKEQVQQSTPENQHHPEIEIERVVVTFQSYVRGEIARKEYSALLRLKKQEKDQNDEEMQALVVEELQKRVLMAETTLELMEKENASLREELQQYQARWSQLEARTKSNEETWQKQIASLQKDLAAALKNAVAESSLAQPEKNEGFNAGSNGMKEKVIAVVKVENSNYAFPVEKLRGLKRSIKAWTKDYKVGVSVRDSNKKMHSVGQSAAADNKPWKAWWGKKSKRSY